LATSTVQLALGAASVATEARLPPAMTGNSAPGLGRTPRSDSMMRAQRSADGNVYALDVAIGPEQFAGRPTRISGS
jgi:hypothetical protein